MCVSLQLALGSSASLLETPSKEETPMKKGRVVAQLWASAPHKLVTKPGSVHLPPSVLRHTRKYALGLILFKPFLDPLTQLPLLK